MVIVLNTLSIGLSTDLHRDWNGWLVVDGVFALCFLSEMLVKMRELGVMTFFLGFDLGWSEGSALEGALPPRCQKRRSFSYPSQICAPRGRIWTMFSLSGPDFCAGPDSGGGEPIWPSSAKSSHDPRKQVQRSNRSHRNKTSELSTRWGLLGQPLANPLQRARSAAPLDVRKVRPPLQNGLGATLALVRVLS